SGGAINDAQWVQVKEEQTQVRGNTATVRDLSHKSGYQPSGHDTEADSHHHQHSNKKRHRKHRSRSRSPSEAKNSRLPDELRQHLDFKLQMAQGMTEAELKEIPYTKVETAKTIKIKFTSPKTKRHKSPRRSKSNSSDRKATPPADGESPPPPYTPSPANKTNTLPKAVHKDGSGEGENENVGSERGGGGGMANDASHPPGPRSLHSSDGTTSSSTKTVGLTSNGKNWSDSSTNTPPTKTSSKPSSGVSYGYSNGNPHKPVMVNGPSVKTLVTNGTSTSSPTFRHEASSPDSSTFMEENGGSLVSTNGFVNSSSNGFKNPGSDRGSHFSSVIKPQPSPQSSVTSGISVGSSSVSISADSTLTSGSHNTLSHLDTPHNHHQQLSSTSNSPDPDDQKSFDHHSYENFSFDQHSYDRSTVSDITEPYYSNCSSYSSQKNHPQFHYSKSLYPDLTSLTQHSTNILIHYHENSPEFSSSSSGNQPIPRPRSSIISSVHSSDSSTHIVQSYGPPSMRNDEHSTNSLQRSGNTSTLPRPAPNNNHNTVGIPPLSSSVTSSPAPIASSNLGGCENSTLPRLLSSNKPHMKTTGSQTNILRTTASQTNHSNSGQRASSKPPPSTSKNPSETNEGIQTANGTNLAHSALHWKVYNWDAYREEAEWSNSLGRSIKGQGQDGNQHIRGVGGHTRRGSAGSLELILGPLIQSALQ
ncbi:hypothetical protein SK128_026140, partial [Halocaridina rubra]